MNITARLTYLAACIPFATPAIKADRCDVDPHLLAHRIKVVAIVIFTAIAATTALVATCGLSSFFIWPWLGLFGLIKLDEWLTLRALDEKAVNEYLQQAAPSASATAWIQKSPRAAELLINKKGDLNKLNAEGCRLIEALINPLYVQNEPSFALFKQLIKENIDLNLKDRHQFSYIERIFQSANPQYLQHLIQEKKIPNSLTDSQKFNFWFHLGHNPIAQKKTFQDLGLSSEIRNSEGLTPLIKLIQLDPSLKSANFSRSLPMDAHVVSLIDNTQLLNQKILIKGKALTLRQFLNLHRQKSAEINKLCQQIEEIEAKQNAVGNKNIKPSI